jgi:hypothetical protein
VNVRASSCGLIFGALIALAPSVATASPGGKESDLPDTIVGKGDKKTKAEVVSEGAKELNYKDHLGKAHTMPWDQIVRIEYKDFPAELYSAEGAIERRDYFKAESAANDAISSCGDGRNKDLFLARARVAKAKALRGQSRYKDAVDMAAQALDAAGGGRWAKGAHLEKVAALAALASDDCAAAGDAAEKFADEVSDVEFKCDVQLLEGYYYEQKNDTSKAKEKYANVKNSQRQEMLERAQLGLARIKILEKDLVGAEEAFKEIAKTSTDPDALAGAQLGLGDIALARAKRVNPISPDDLRVALELYLRGSVLAQPVGGGSSDNHEKTLANAAEVCKLIASQLTVTDNKKDPKYEKQASGKRFFIDYARKLFEDLVKTYPSSTKVEEYRAQINDLRAKSVALSPPAEGAK